MATYNGEAHVAEQLASILANDRLPDELIVIDDCSTDGTVGVVQKLLDGHSGMDVIIEVNTTNLGPTATFVKGLLLSTGDLVLTADQDDICAPEKISRMLDAFLADPQVVMMYSDGVLTDDRLVPTGATIFGTRRRPHLHLGDGREPLEIAANPDIKGCTMAMKGSLVRELLARTGPSFQPYWGHDHWIALFAFGLGNVVALKTPLIQHRIHGRNTSAGMRLRPWSAIDLRKWLRGIRKQDADHFVQRYRRALQQAEHYGPSFSAPLKKALESLLDLSTRREQLRRLPFFARTKAVLKIHRDGSYREHYNGVFTLLRDLFL